MKKIYLLIIIIFIYSCGYSPLYIANKNDMLLNLKKIEGDFELNNYIKNDFKIASDFNSPNIFDIKAKTKFEVYDAFGNLLKIGSGRSVDCRNIVNGIYYINYDNKSEKFIKVN